MAGVQCTNLLLYSTPALVFTKEKAGLRTADGSDGATKQKGVIRTDEDKVLRGCQIFTDMAQVLCLKKGYREALPLLDTAVELDETNASPYLVRAAALIKLGRYKEAHMELDHIGETKNPRVFMLRTMASWYSGEFEQAAVSASRGNRTRSQPPLFKEILNAAIGSIERCIGPSAGDILLESSDEIFQLEETKKVKTPLVGEKQYCDVTLAEARGRKSTVTSANRAHRCAMYKKERSLYLMQLHLGRLAVSGRYLSSLADLPGFDAPNQKGVERMRLLIKCIMMDLEKRLEELMMDMPMYVYNSMAFIEKSAKMQENDTKRQQEHVDRTEKLVHSMLMKILIVREKNAPLESLYACHRARNVITSTPKKVLLQKRMYLNIVYHLMGIVLLEAKLMDPTLTEAANKSNILGWLGIRRNKDVIMKNSKFPFMDYKSLLSWAMPAYHVSPSRLERAWLLYVIAAVNEAYGNYDGCRNHIRRSVNEARAAGSHVWAINGLVIQAQSELQLNSKLDAKNSIKEAIELAQELKDESIISVLAHMNEAIEEQSADMDTSADERRFYKRLVAMMPTHAMKNEMRHVLHHRAYLSKPRRLPIIVRRDSPPNLGDTAEDAEKEQGPRLWPRRKRSN